MEYRSSGDTADYLHDVTSSLSGSEEVSSVVWTIPAGLTLLSQSDTTTGSVIQIDITGENGQRVELKSKISTSIGNIYNRYWYIVIQKQLD